MEEQIIINTFTGGMDQDSSKLTIANNKALEVYNMRPLTDEGSSNGALVNVRGNAFHINIPDAPRIFKLIDDTISFGIGITFTQDIVTTVGTYTLSFVYDAVNFKEFLDQYQSALILNTDLASLGIRSARPTNEDVLVWLEGGENITSFIAGSGLLDFLYADVVQFPVVIGYTTIRDNVILFTASNDIAGIYGQIWEISYVDAVPSIRLAYHAPINFSKEHPIQAIGRYENPRTRRVYWTDNYNTPRSLNLASIDTMAVSIDTLGLLPSIRFTRPIYGEVSNTGVLPTGVYQYAYRLKSDGLVTRFSPLSQCVHIVVASESSAVYWRINDPNEYIGNTVPSPTNKAIQMSLTNLDIRYETVEIVSIYRTTSTGTPVVRIIEEQFIPTSGSITFTHTGNEIVSEMTIDEFLFLSVNFDKVKTLATKDNRLLLGNVTTSEFTDLRFNCRAYRWNSSQETYVGSGVAADTDWQDIDPFDVNTRQSFKDAINPFNANPNVVTGLQYIYQSDGTTLGGEGPFVKYQFVKQVIEGDTSHSYKIAADQAQTAPFINKARTIVSFDLRDDCAADQNNHWRDFKNPLVNGMVKGYQRGEIYRFALVLYDLAGRPSFAEWIGDIRFPEHYTPDPRFTGISADFHLYKKDGYNDASDLQQGNTLGIEFDITIPSDIREKITGYSVVRVDRTLSDKTRLGDGMLQVLKPNTGGSPNVDPDDCYFIPNVFGNWTPANDISERHVIGYFPEFLFNEHPTYNSGDRLVIHSISEEVPTLKDEVGLRPNCSYYKMWDCQDITVGQTNFYDLEDSTFLGRGQVHQFSGEDKFINYAWNTVDDDIYSAGNHCTYMLLSANLTWGDIYPYGIPSDFTDATHFSKFFATYERRVSDQYGGNTESDRSKNTYITCNNFIKFDAATSTTNQVFEVFGGDTYITFFGNTSGEKNIGNFLLATMPNILYPAALANPSMHGHFFPCETTFNNELRYDYHLANKADYLDSYLFPDVELAGKEGQYAFDMYKREPVYSFMNDTAIVYIPRPFNVDFVQEYDTRVYASNVKINGESTDNWRIFDQTTYRDAEGLYGPINNLIRFQDNIYYFQDKAMGRLLINPRAVVQAVEGTSLELGNGSILHEFDYISTVRGCKHQWAITATDVGIYWYDVLGKAILRLASNGADPISSIAGMSAFVSEKIEGTVLYNDNPILNQGVCASYNSLNKFKEILFTFRSTTGEGDFEVTKNVTLCYIEDEKVRAFTAFYDFHPSIYINTGNTLITPSTNGNSWNDLYLHNVGNYCEWYGITYDCKLSFYTHEAAPYTKIFTNVSWHTECLSAESLTIDAEIELLQNILNETWERVRFSNDTQNTDWITLNTVPLSGNLRRVQREWAMAIPRNKVKPNVTLSGGNIFSPLNLDASRLFKEQLRDKYMRVDLSKSNDSRHKFCAHYVRTFLMPSFR